MFFFNVVDDDDDDNDVVGADVLRISIEAFSRRCSCRSMTSTTTQGNDDNCCNDGNT